MTERTVGDDGIHRFPLGVYFADTDAAGIVYHARYLEFAERARFELWRALDIALDPAYDPAANPGAEVLFVVRRLSVDYLRPARLGDALLVLTEGCGLTGATVRLKQQVVFAAGGVSALLDVTLACLDRRLRPVRVPAALKRQFSRFTTPAAQ